jgi:hypothetical protein
MPWIPQSAERYVAAYKTHGTQRVPHGKRRGAKTLDLPAATLTLQHPGAEVFAVVRQEPIAELAQSRACACHDFAAIEAWPVMSNPDAAATSEVRQRNLLHWSPSPPAREAAVVNDAPIADVDAVVAVESASGDEVRRERRLGGAKKGIVRGKVLIASTDVACHRRSSRSLGETLCTLSLRADCTLVSIDTKGSGGVDPLWRTASGLPFER